MLEYFGNSEISKLDEAVVRQENILSFEVSVNDFAEWCETYLLWMYLRAKHIWTSQSSIWC